MSEFFSGITFPWQKVTPSDDASVRRSVLADGILSGCEISYIGSTLTMGTGLLIGCGRQFRHTAVQNFAVTGASSGYARLVITIDTTKASTKDAFDQIGTAIEYATALDGFTQLRQDDINEAGTIYQMQICVVSLGAGGISGIVKKIPGTARKAFAYNLLDNSDFRNPVNQRGSTNYVDLGYTIDRWTSVNYGNTVTVADGYIHLKTTDGGSWRQLIEKANRYIGKKMTIAAKLLDGSIVCASGTVPNTSDDAEIVTYKGPDYEVSLHQFSGNLVMQFSVFASEISIKWAALYEGEYTAETLPEYQPKGYGTELLECRRYYQELNYNALGNGYTISGGGAAVLIVNTGIQMRIVPTLVGEKNITVRADGTDYSAQFNNISMYEYGNGAVCEIVVSGTIPAKQSAAFFATGKVALSADL